MSDKLDSQRKRRRSDDGNKRESRKRGKTSAETSSSSGSSGHDDDIGHILGNPGDVIVDRYEVKKTVGLGTFGKVLQCYDRKYRDIVALKVVRKIPRYVQSAQIEADILWDVNKYMRKEKVDFVVKFYSDFKFDGHYGMVFEPLGMSLFDFVRMNNYRGFPLYCVKDIARQLLGSLRFLKEMNLIHTDLKLENILFVDERFQVYDETAANSNQGKGYPIYDPRENYHKSENRRESFFNRQRGQGVTSMLDQESCSGRSRSRERVPSSSTARMRSSESTERSGTTKEELPLLVPRSTRIKLIDFGGATYDDQRKSTIVNTRQYRGPEVILESGWSFPSDIWGAGCIIAEIYSGELLFPTHENLEHLCMMEHLLGRFPSWLVNRSPVKQKYFHSDGSFRVSQLSESSWDHINDQPSLRRLISKYNHRDEKLLQGLMRGLLEIDPHQRITAKEALKEPFFESRIR